MVTNQNKSMLKWSIRLIIFTAVINLFFTYIFGNIFSLIIEKEYFIPEQSSIFAFRETVHNDGSSDVWRYGEDNSNYYYNLSTFKNKVLFFSKKNIGNCPGFNSEDVTTWCKVKIPKTAP